MENPEHVIKQQLREQLALEEHLCRTMEEQIAGIDERYFADAKKLLRQTISVLTTHFASLNGQLDQLEQRSLNERNQMVAMNGAVPKNSLGREQQKGQLYRVLRDAYSALNLITMSNTLLHTTALALGSGEVAALALKHLENLVPLVIRLGELTPEVLALELHAESSSIDLSVAKIALKNTQLVWRKAS